MLSKSELDELRKFKDVFDDNAIKYKEIIKNKLLDNNKIIEILDNKDLLKDDAEPDEYYGINIKPYYLIPDTQTSVKNFICYEVSFNELSDMNPKVKLQQIIFYVLCNEDNIIEKNTYTARHDLLGALIIEEFNWTNYFGAQLHCVQNRPSIIDNHYACRTIIFEQVVPNNITKSKDYKNKLITHEVHI